MTKLKITAVVAAFLIIAACKSKKETTSSSSTTQNNTTTSAPTATVTAAPAKSTNGIYAPGEEELTAIKTKYPDATAKSLKEGYDLYVGKCTDCHRSKSIYKYPEAEWPGIIRSMSKKSNLTPTETDALTKFVFSIKATQPAAAK